MANPTPMPQRIIVQIATLLLVFVLVYTGLTKWINFNHFSRSMLSQPLPYALTNVLIYLIPFIEIVAALLLIPQHTRQLGLWITSLLMIAFTAYVVYIKLSALENTTCPCGGLFSQLNWNQHTWVNSLLTIIAITTTLIYRNLFPGHGKRRNADASHQTK